MKNTHGGVLILVKLKPATLLKLTLLLGCFSRFLNWQTVPNILDDTFKQTGSHSVQETHLYGLPESSNSSKRMESENRYDLSHQHGKNLL